MCVNKVERERTRWRDANGEGTSGMKHPQWELESDRNTWDHELDERVRKNERKRNKRRRRQINIWSDPKEDTGIQRILGRDEHRKMNCPKIERGREDTSVTGSAREIGR